MALWTVAEDDKLKALYADQYSCAQIAGFMPGKTRNAIIGRVHRMNLPKRGSGTLPARATREPRIRRPSHVNVVPLRPRLIKPPREQTELRCAAIDPQHITLLDLQHDQCRWPYGDTEITYCGHQIFQGSYCGAHYFLSIGPGTASEQAAHKVSKNKTQGAW